MSGSHVTFVGGAMMAVVQGVTEVRTLLGKIPQLEVLRAAAGAESVEPAAVLLPTPHGAVKVDVLEVRQVEIDHPSDDPGDRLHASAHAWANDSATDLTIEVVRRDGQRIEVTTPVAEPGPLIAMKLQAIMNRSVDKQGTDLLDIIRLTFDEATRGAALQQIAGVADNVAQDIRLHVDLWFDRNRQQALRWIHSAGGRDITIDDLDLVADLLGSSAQRLD